ncbi:MAG: glycoside hydrolase family 3 C-terminal domain-containing protein, partial [Bacteroidales bacterium]|nr:glycoside hydrolase family 3 C-terminal domain-containing protein [Bacteroidales bacterium]
MKKLTICAAVALAAMLASCAGKPASAPSQTGKSNAYMADAEANAMKIIGELSLKEKLAQIQSGSIYVIKDASDSLGNLSFDTLRKYYPYGMGLMNIDFGGCPPEKYARTVNSLKEYNNTLEHPVPMIFIGEGLHGLMGVDATCFPQAIALGCSWDTTLLRKVYKTTRVESKARGINMLFSPILDLAREPRFGRIEEMYSEDPFLCGTYGSVAVDEFQQMKADGMLEMAATLKHYMGHGQMEGGRNVACYPGSANDLMNNHSIPFEMCVDAGVAGVMPAYNDVCDLPVTVNKWLLKGVLREQMGFDGLIISDQNAVDRMYDVNHLTASYREAAELAIQCGIDIDIIGREGTFQMLEQSVKEGKIKESVIDSALKRLLILKWRLGLFQKDDPVDIPALMAVNQCKEHLDLARETARKTMVLLKNDGVLPINKSSIRKIAVIGPNANTLDYGGYTAEPVTAGVSVYEGIRAYGEANNIKVQYAEGVRLSNAPIGFWKDNNHTPITEAEANKMMAEAVAMAKGCDVIVLCMGENVSYSREAWGDYHRGDRESLELLGYQNELAKRLKATGKPVVTLIFGGRPLNVRPALENANALAQCFYLGQQGGNAVADVLFGDYNFEGKLSVSMPSSAGALPCWYNMKPNRFRSYIYEDRGDTIFPLSYDANSNKYSYQEGAWEPPTTHAVFPFGYGLSYSKFQFGEPKASADTLPSSQTVKIKINVKNISDIDGSETVQLYIRDEVCSCVRPVKELKGFQKVYLKAGES